MKRRCFIFNKYPYAFFYVNQKKNSLYIVWETFIRKCIVVSVCPFMIASNSTCFIFVLNINYFYGDENYRTIELLILCVMKPAATKHLCKLMLYMTQPWYTATCWDLAHFTSWLKKIFEMDLTFVKWSNHWILILSTCVMCLCDFINSCKFTTCIYTHDIYYWTGILNIYNID